MAALTIRNDEDWNYMNHHITGFEPKELDELASMSIEDAKEKVIEMLDERNHGIGTCWAHGYGIYGFSIGPDGVLVRTSKSCD